MPVEEGSAGMRGTAQETTDRDDAARKTDGDESMQTAKPVVETPRCRQCGGAIGRSDVMINHSPSDPLVVSECANCGAIVSIGGHAW